jgi:5'-nucleotidase
MRTRDIILLVAAAVVIVLAFSFVVSGDDKDHEAEFIILHSNDTHCYFGDDGTLGFSTLKALKDRYEAEGNIVFVMDAGDFLQGNANGTLTQGEASVEVMNEVGYDVGVPGNHEFDFTFPVLMERASDLNYPLICSNLIYGSTGESIFPEYLILEKGGVRLGCFGLLTPDTKDTTADGNMGDAVVTDPIDAATRMVSLLRGMDVDYVIAIGHIGVSRAASITSDYICSVVPGIDIFVDGHSHTEMEDGKVCDGSIEILESDTVIVSTGAYSKNVGVVTVRVDGKIIAKLYRGAKLHDDDVDAVIDEVEGAIEEICGQKVGYTSILLDGDRKDVRVRETNLGDLISDGVRTMTGADIALFNGGTIRKSIDIGDITLGDVYDVLPFQDDLVIVTATGQNVKDAIECSLSFIGHEFGGYLHVSGFEVTFDRSKDPGSRVLSMRIDGSEMSMTEEYRVGMPDFLAKGGDGNVAFVGLDSEVYGDTTETISEYLSSIGTIEEGTIQMGRVVQSG